MKRVLFVDDEPMILQGIQHSLRSMRAEWEVEFASGGAEALEMMERAPFDVVITDMRMPGMDGAQLLELVKASFRGRSASFFRGNPTVRTSCVRSVLATSICRSRVTWMNSSRG
jgi:CheY-like chemotaxis protein